MSPRPTSEPVHAAPLCERTQELSSDRARTLLRRLRDLNLFAGPVAVTREAAFRVAGCLSVDGPAEGGVRYRLRDGRGRESTLEIEWTGVELALAVESPPPNSRRELRVALACDARGFACARAIGARVRPESASARELEHFLRRVVRAIAR